MKIIIELDNTVSAAAEARIKQMAIVTMSHDIDFNDDKVEVQRGDYTIIETGSGHRNAPALYELVQRITQGDEFETDPEGFLLVPFPGGGVARIRQRGRPLGPVASSMNRRIDMRMTTNQKEKLEALGGVQWLRDQIDKSDLCLSK